MIAAALAVGFIAGALAHRRFGHHLQRLLHRYFPRNRRPPPSLRSTHRD